MDFSSIQGQHLLTFLPTSVAFSGGQCLLEGGIYSNKYSNYTSE